MIVERREPRKQPQRVSTQHCLVLGFLERRRPPEIADAGDGEVAANIGMIRSEQDLTEPDVVRSISSTGSRHDSAVSQ